MIPILYDSTETIFASNGLGRLRDCISCVVTEERNGEYVCDFEYPVDGILYDNIQLGRIIGVEHDDTNDVQPFDIVSCERPINGVVTFHCQHISYRLSGIVTSGKNVNSLADAFTMFASGVPNQPFSFSADFTSTGYMASADGVPRSVRQIMGGIEGSILDTYGGEWEFDKWNAILHRARGVQRNFSIRYGVNLVDYNEEIDYSESFNMAIPFWYDKEEGLVKGDLIDSGETTYNGQNVCIPLDLTEKFEEKPTIANLNAMAESMLNGSTLPKQTIEVNFIRLTDTEDYKRFASLQKCSLCDLIHVVFPMYGMSGQFKIVKTVYNVLLERYDSMELGTLSTSLSEALGITNSLEDGLDEASSGLFISTRTDVGAAFRHTVDTVGHDIGFRATVDDDVNNIHSNLFFGIGGSGVNRGIYDTTAGKWTIYRDSTSSVKIPSPLSVSGAITAEGHDSTIGTGARVSGTTKTYSSSTSWQDASNSNAVTLSAGSWLIIFTGVFAANGTTGTRAIRPNIGGTASAYGQSQVSPANNAQHTLTCVFVDTTSTSRTYYAEVFQNGGSNESITVHIQYMRIA